MKKVFFEEENGVTTPVKKFGYWLVNVGLFILLGLISAAALVLTAVVW